MICAICQTSAEDFGEALVLDKYQVQYFRCAKCGFIQTEKPYWLSEAYAEALVAADVGIMQRNLQTSAVTPAVISMLFPKGKKFLDYGGGHGTFVRLMRDRGFDFFWQDRYAKNVHARTFEHIAGTQYDLITAFELLEHLPNPLADLSEAFSFSDNVLTTTLLVPDPPPPAKLVVLRCPRRTACFVLYSCCSEGACPEFRSACCVERRLPLVYSRAGECDQASYGHLAEDNTSGEQVAP